MFSEALYGTVSLTTQRWKAIFKVDEVGKMQSGHYFDTVTDFREEFPKRRRRALRRAIRQLEVHRSDCSRRQGMMPKREKASELQAPIDVERQRKLEALGYIE